MDAGDGWWWKVERVMGEWEMGGEVTEKDRIQLRTSILQCVLYLLSVCTKIRE